MGSLMSFGAALFFLFWAVGTQEWFAIGFVLLALGVVDWEEVARARHPGRSRAG